MESNEGVKQAFKITYQIQKARLRKIYKEKTKIL